MRDDACTVARDVGNLRQGTHRGRGDGAAIANEGDVGKMAEALVVQHPRIHVKEPRREKPRFPWPGRRQNVVDTG